MKRSSGEAGNPRRKGKIPVMQKYSDVLASWLADSATPTASLWQAGTSCISSRVAAVT